MQLIKLVFESLCRALIRFFDNRAIRNTDIEYYRMELEKQRLETQSLIQQLLIPVKTAEVLDDNEVLMPIGKSKFKSWEQKRRELENQSRLKALANANEARVAIERTKTTEELEDELLTGND